VKTGWIVIATVALLAMLSILAFLMREGAPVRQRPLSDNPSLYAAYVDHYCDGTAPSISPEYFMTVAVDCAGA
jgi:hypothetical protein